MSNYDPDPDTRQTDTEPSHREGIAEAFGRDTDPLAQYAPRFEELDFDPFQAFREDKLVPKGLADKTLRSYETCFDYWREYMAQQGRHPACPNEQHVVGFIHHLRNERGHSGKHLLRRITQLQGALEYWQNEAAFPHPGDFDPFSTALDRTAIEKGHPDEYVEITFEEIREKVRAIKHVRERAIVVTQLKLGLRASEVTNIRLEDVNLQHPDLDRDYPEMGTRSEIADYDNAVYIPANTERDHNKSDRPRILPLDDEVRQTFIDYLLPRPTDGQPWLFLTSSASQMRPREVREAWVSQFWPEFEGDENHRGISSHYGRHFFTTFWRVEQDLNRDLIKYMRGDTTDPSVPFGRETIDTYIHTTYENIEGVYRERVFKLRL